MSQGQWQMACSRDVGVMHVHANDIGLALGRAYSEPCCARARARTGAGAHRSFETG